MATRTKKYSEVQLRKLVEEATVDCYDDDEQVMGLMAMIEDRLAVPFETKVLEPT